MRHKKMTETSSQIKRTNTNHDVLFVSLFDLGNVRKLLRYDQCKYERERLIFNYNFTSFYLECIRITTASHMLPFFSVRYCHNFFDLFFFVFD